MRVGLKKTIGELREVSDLFYLAMIDADPTSLMAELTSLIGAEAAMTIIDIFGGMTIKVPSRKKIANAVKNAAVWNDHEKSLLSIDEIADKHNITPSKVLKIIDRWSTLHRAGKAVGYAD